MPWQRTAHLCSCGCGKPLRELTRPDGRFKGYSGHYAPDCPNRETLVRRKNPAKGHRGMAHPRALPIGSRRQHSPGDGTGPYWQVKVAETGRWPYEHRVIAERLLGRCLLPGEQVHHENEDTLDNREENLVVLTLVAHRRHHNAVIGWARGFSACAVCGETSRKHAARGRCTRCYQRP